MCNVETIGVIPPVTLVTQQEHIFIFRRATDFTPHYFLVWYSVSRLLVLFLLGYQLILIAKESVNALVHDAKSAFAERTRVRDLGSSSIHPKSPLLSFQLSN
jgi:hypothetical protein